MTSSHCQGDELPWPVQQKDNYKYKDNDKEMTKTMAETWWQITARNRIRHLIRERKGENLSKKNTKIFGVNVFNKALWLDFSYFHRSWLLAIRMLPRAERGRERLATCAPMSLSTLATKLPFLLFYAIVLLQRTINTAKGQTFSKFCSSQAQILHIGNISEPGKRPSPYFQGHPTL